MKFLKRYKEKKLQKERMELRKRLREEERRKIEFMRNVEKWGDELAMDK